MIIKSRYESRLSPVTCCSQCSGIIFIIVLALLMYDDHAFIMQKLLQYFEGRVTHMTKTNTTQVLDI